MAYVSINVNIVDPVTDICYDKNFIITIPWNVLFKDVPFNHVKALLGPEDNFKSIEEANEVLNKHFTIKVDFSANANLKNHTEGINSLIDLNMFNYIKYFGGDNLVKNGWTTYEVLDYYYINQELIKLSVSRDYLEESHVDDYTIYDNDGKVLVDPFYILDGDIFTFDIKYNSCLRCVSDKDVCDCPDPEDIVKI